MSDIEIKSSLLARVQKMQANSPKRSKQKSNDRQLMPLHLPKIGDSYRAMPNHIARSSLFAPIGAKPKQVYRNAILVSRKDAVIKFWGEQLDESQADVWMQVMFEASKLPLGEPVVIKRARFLQAIGRNTSGANYEWLDRSMKSLAFAMLVIEVNTKSGANKLTIGTTAALHMIDNFDYDSALQVYTLRIDPRWHQMYRNREFSLIEWDKRLRFSNKQDMAKALQRLISTSNDEIQYYSLDWLKEKFVYTGRLRDFRQAVEKAMNDLTRLNFITEGRIDISAKGNTQVVWRRLKSS
ncbi:plasmid replication initiator TrfA [Yersinia thracica]|uniref:plasmid replication initiator TrfA n=1 Tax=Yersinia thracica TaxID=2890319 RepID=UPI00119D4F3C|nr:plasmid replication initiator TrfA [Yersinia thracica]